MTHTGKNTVLMFLILVFRVMNYQTSGRLGNDHFLLQYVDFPTHCYGNILDLGFTNNDSLIHSVAGIEPLRTLSRHKIVTATTQYKYLNTDKS